MSLPETESGGITAPPAKRLRGAQQPLSLALNAFIDFSCIAFPSVISYFSDCAALLASLRFRAFSDVQGSIASSQHGPRELASKKETESAMLHQWKEYKEWSRTHAQMAVPSFGFVGGSWWSTHHQASFCLSRRCRKRRTTTSPRPLWNRLCHLFLHSIVSYMTVLAALRNVALLRRFSAKSSTGVP